MSVPTVVASVLGVSAFAGAGLIGSGHLGWGRTGGDGTRPGLWGRPPRWRREPSRSGPPGSGGGRIRRAAAHWARPGDLAALVLPRDRTGATPTGRLVLGRSGRSLVAAERAQSVIVFGPTQSHKTSGFAVPALLEWSGPIVAASVKTDLIDHTLTHRRSCGEVQCFDPSGSTGLDSATWSPLPTARTWPSARRAAAALTEVARSSVGTMTDGDFWYATASRMLAPLLFAAAVGRRDMGDVVRWVDTHEEAEVLDLLADAGVPEALDAARSAFGKEERQRSSIYTTVETILEPFAPTAQSTAAPWGADPGRSVVDPAGLLRGDNTLYLCAPAHDQRRLTPLFVSVIRQIIEHVYDRVTLTHRPIDPPLLVVLDEAANIAPLADLDALAATAAGHGVQLVTVWHDLAQITARYGTRATTVVNNHRAKLFLSGISDPTTLDYASHLIGDEEVLLPATTHGSPSGPSTTRSPTTRRLAPPDALRRIPPGEGVLVYGDLPPSRLALRPWFADPVLRSRSAPDR